MPAPYVKKEPKTFEKYGLIWPATSDPIAIEQHMIQRGGQWKKKDGSLAGEGLFFHFKAFESLLWPHKVWHKWSDMILECYLKHRTIGILGPASTGKTFCCATDVLADYYCFPDCTTVLCCSTTLEMLEQRVWGEIKRHHTMAKDKRSWIPGHIMDSRKRIVTDSRYENVEGRDFRNGLLCVPARVGGNFVGLGSLAGVKNKRVRILADELSLCPRVFVDAISNLDKNPDFKAVGMGNPKETTDALGVLCEPSVHLGGWDGNIDQTGGTKTWETRRPMGVCIQLPGSDSPNLDGKLGIPLITQADIDRDIAFYGKDSLWFTMMDEGRMPRGQGSRRVLTRGIAMKNHAMDDPIWRDSRRTKIACLDAAYKGVGGDRCVYAEMEYGDEAEADLGTAIATAIINQADQSPKRRKLLALTDIAIIPIVGNSKEEAEEQIVEFVRERCKSANISPENFFFDSGMRTGLVTAFSRLWSPSVMSIDCGGAASTKPVSAQIPKLCKDYYSKYVTELWYSVRLAVEAGQFRGMTEEVLMEFCQREWKMVGNNKIEVEAKAEMKQKCGRSPDLADCVSIGVEGARRRGFVIDNLVSKSAFSKESQKWKNDILNKAKEARTKHSLDYAA